MLNPEDKNLINEINRKIPLLRFYLEGEEFGEYDYVPPTELTITEFLLLMRSKGLDIVRLKKVI